VNVRNGSAWWEGTSRWSIAGQAGVWMCCCWLLGCAPQLFAAEVVLEPGWGQSVRLGRWNLATTEYLVEEAGTYQLTCRAPDNEGHVVVYTSPATEAAAGETLRLQVPYLLGRPDGQLQWELQHSDKVIWQQTLRCQGKDLVTAPLVLSDRLIITHGKPQGFNALNSAVGIPGKAGRRVVELAADAALPVEPLAYEAVDWLVLMGSAAPSEPARAAIQQWVQRGGRLIISLPLSADLWQASPLREWLPLTIPAEYVAARGLGDLEAFAGRNIRIPFVSRLEIPAIPATPGVVLASSRELPLLLRTSWGFGEVFVIAVDLTQPPLSNWGGLNDFVHKLIGADAAATVAQRQESRGVTRPLTSSGITDLASQLMATQDVFPEVRRPAPWWSMAWLLLLLAVVGPLDYLLVHRVLQRPRWTWITLPIWLTTATGFAAYTGQVWNSSTRSLNQLDIVDVDVASNFTRSETWLTTLAPEICRQSIVIQPTAEDWRHLWAPDVTTTQPLSWQGIPETTTGGLYRPSGTEWGRTQYQIATDHAAVNDLPLLQGATRTLSTRWTAESTQLVEAHLRNTGLGRLTGEMTHHLPGTLTDWMLVYGSRVYRWHTARNSDEIQPWPAGVRFSTDAPLTLQNDLKNIITQTVITRENEEGKSTEKRLRHEQTRYDVGDRSPDRLWQVLSFHDAVGGLAYTGLTNTGLEQHDFSSQLDMGHAVVFGRLESTPPATVTINGAALPAETSVVYVRLVIPVQSSGEVLRVLPKFGDDDARK